MIATGGLDEMAIDIWHVLFSGIFLRAAGLTAFSWWKHSLAAAVVAGIFVLLNGVLIASW